MWNKENTIRLIGKVTKEYGKEIIAEGSKSVMGMEDHIDRIIAEIIGVESEAITAAREWRKIIQRAAMTEGIDKVISNLTQENSIIVEEKANNRKQEIETGETTIIREEISKADNNNTKEVEMTLEENQPKLEIEDERKERVEKMEGIKITSKEEIAKGTRYKKISRTIKETNKEAITENNTISLNHSI